MKYTKKAPCPECPFRKTAIQGYLGPETVESIQPFVHGEQGWVCHMSISGKPTDDEGRVAPEHGHVCLGAIICAIKSCKSYRPGELGDLQKQMRGHEATPEIMDWREFVQYHKRQK